MQDKIQQEAKNDAGMQNLQSIPGVGPVVAYAFTAHIGDGSRFSTGAQVSNFIGFVPRLDYSGTIQHNGPITKHGNGYVRGLLVQVRCILKREGLYRSGISMTGYEQEEDYCRNRAPFSFNYVLDIERQNHL